MLPRARTATGLAARALPRRTAAVSPALAQPWRDSLRFASSSNGEPKQPKGKKPAAPQRAQPAQPAQSAQPAAGTAAQEAAASAQDAAKGEPAAADAPAKQQPSLAQEYLDLVEGTDDAESSRRRTGARAQSDSQSSIERKRKRMISLLSILALAGLGYELVHLGRDWDSDEERHRLTSRSDDERAIEYANAGDAWHAFLGRLMLRSADLADYFNKPAWDPLLPDPLPPPHGHAYTLVVDLDDLLVHANWDRDHGWRTAKRPGVDYFLAYLAQFYEIVLFTTQPAYTAIPIAEKLDPYGAHVPYKLFRESTRFKNNATIKDLSYLGRPLERTIIIDTNPEHVQLQPNNAILLKPWEGQAPNRPPTKELVDLIPFLEALAINEVKDVRPVLKHYEGKHIPTAYAEAEQRLRDDMRVKWQEQKQGGRGWISYLVGSIFGSTRSDQPPEPKVVTMRRLYQQQYKVEQQYWKDNEEAIKKTIEEDKERQLAAMRGQSVFGLLGGMGGAPPPEQQPK